MQAISVMTGGNQTLAEGGTLNLSGVSFTDGNPANTHTALINWGDGNTTPGVVTESSGQGTVSGSHVYGAVGSYTVSITLSRIKTPRAAAVLGCRSITCRRR